MQHQGHNSIGKGREYGHRSLPTVEELTYILGSSEWKQKHADNKMIIIIIYIKKYAQLHRPRLEPNN